MSCRPGHVVFCVALALSALASSAQSQDRGRAPTPAEQQAYKRPDSIPFPKENPYTPEKAALGKMLFFDTRLSRDRNLSCASCHNPSFGWEVPFAQAIGAGGKPLARHAPTALNHAWSTSLFWDGRAATLEAQARGPIEAPVEMDLPMAEAVRRLGAVEGYRKAFQRAFPQEGLTESTILKAIATFERTIVTGDTPFDQWLRGKADAIPVAAQRGFALFNGKARCVQCHTGWNFTDNRFYDIGLSTEDKGRMVQTGRAEDQHGFRTPGLREIATRAPYMHSGQLATLEVVIAHYNSGGTQRASLSNKMKPLGLTPAEVHDLAAFLRTLSSAHTRMPMPNLPSH